MLGLLSNLRLCLNRRRVCIEFKSMIFKHLYRNLFLIPNIFQQNLERKHLCSQAHYGNIHIYGSHVELTGSSCSPVAQFSYLWLRDHCRCEKCYNHTTNQRKLNILDIPSDIQPQSCSIKDDILHVAWPDGHNSQYPLTWLMQCSYSSYCEAERSKWVPWNKTNINTCGIAAVPLEMFNGKPAGIQDLLGSLVKFGVGFVKDVPPTLEATEKVVQHVTHVQRTFFGDMWEFSDIMSHSDTAYTREALGAHTDNTYFTEASGLQVFHCLHHDGEGGESLLVDGFNAAMKLRETHPDSYHRLSKVAIESEYIEAGQHYSSTGPILHLHPVTRELQQIRFNLFDRAPMKTLHLAEERQFYEDLRLLSNIITNPEGEWWLKLQPGTVVFINNWRVLHGRAAYTGHRKMAGCYVGHADWCSKARVLGLL